ncbi:lysine-specific demethylase PHF2-like [Forsythia ovata]|uniref:Lysine-specific demethylase PHF2-like n=1 Tax=Forsythia ovata TaxID=205694 RepID=A0ABD1X3P0_9LAMI
MEYIKLKEREIVFDIESGGTSCGNDSVSGRKHAEELFKKVGSSVLGFHGSSEVEPGLKSKGVSGESIEESHESVRLLIEKNPGGLQSQDLMPVVEKRREKEQLKIGKFKKAPKPPRPPKGPTLDAVDMKLEDRKGLKILLA